MEDSIHRPARIMEDLNMEDMTSIISHRPARTMEVLRIRLIQDFGRRSHHHSIINMLSLCSRTLAQRRTWVLLCRPLLGVRLALIFGTTPVICQVAGLPFQAMMRRGSLANIDSSAPPIWKAWGKIAPHPSGFVRASYVRVIITCFRWCAW